MFTKSRLLLTVFFVLLTFGHVRAQLNPLEGTSFYVSFVPNNIPNPGIDLIFTSASSTVVTVENPALGYSQSYNVAANTPYTATIPSSVCINTTNNTIEQRVLHVTSTNPISLYGSNYLKASADATLFFPENTNGTRYYVASFTGGTATPTSFLVVGMEDSTVVQITPSNATISGQFQHIPYQIVLNKGDSYLEYGATRTDLTGTLIESVNNKKIAVMGGCNCATIPDGCLACDVLMEQMMPISTLGRKYMVNPLVTKKNPSTKLEYTYRILSTKDSNDIYINGKYYNTIFKGYSKYLHNETRPICIESTRPIMVMQYLQGDNCNGGGDPAMTVIPPVSQTIEKLNYGVPQFSDFEEHNICITTKTDSKNLLTINGNSIPSTDFKLYDSCADYCFVTIPATSGNNYFIQSDSGFIAMGYGFGKAISYIQVAGTNTRILEYGIDEQGIECGALTFDFKTTGDMEYVVSSRWDFGDLTTATGNTITKTYTSHGTYNVTNIVGYLDRNGDTRYDTAYRTIKTLIKPIAKQTTTGFVSNVCFKDNITSRVDVSQYPIAPKTKSVWLFSDTTLTYTNQDTIYRSYTSPNTSSDTLADYIIYLIAYNTDNCTDTNIISRYIYPSAIAKFTTETSQCFNENKLQPVQLSETGPGGYIKGYKWDFGDGTTDTTASPSKKYTDTGSYKISLIAYEGTSNCNDTSYSTFTVLPSPQTGFTYTNACHGDSLLFNNTSAIQKGSMTYTWSYGDGYSSAVTNQNHLYTDTGRYTVQLKALSNLLCADSIQKTVTVYPRPRAGFLTNKTVCAKNNSIFLDQTQRYNVPALKNVWAFGDGNSIQNAGNAAYTYPATGMYTVKLVTTSTDGCTDSTQQTVNVSPLPTVAFSVNDSDQCLKGNHFAAASTSFVQNGGLKTLNWYINNAPLGIGSYKEFSQPAAGVYMLKLVVMSDSFCSDSVTKPITINPQASLDVLINDTTQCLGSNLFTFSNISSISMGSLSYTWDLSTGDIVSATDIMPKSFSVPGNYSVRLVSISDKGCMDTLERFLRVDYSPNVDFIPLTVCENDSAVFFNITDGGAGGWLWDFGDGNTSTAKEPRHKYASAGIYRVRLIGESANGCSDTAVNDTGVIVFPAPRVYFTTEIYDNINGVTQVQFTNKSQYGTNFSWAFGNGNASRNYNPLEHYTDTGFFRVSLSAINNFNCYDDFDTLLHIAPDYSVLIPSAFTPNKDPLNKVFKIEGTLYYQTFAMYIYNRWGELMFYTNDPLIGWDGRYKGEPVPEGIYGYFIQIADIKSEIKEYKGSIHLLR